MITPAFELSQEEDFLVFSIRVPYTRMSEFDLYIDGEDFKFYAKPYFLRLTLPGRIVEDGREKASFDINKGLFTLRVPKETAGQHFEGLEMLTSLLAPRGSRSAKPLVEDMDACGRSEEGEEEDSDDFDWQVEQEVYTECSGQELNSFQKYGFGNKRSGVFIRLQEELGDVIDVSNPDATTAVERRQGRLAAETAKFDPDHYLADLFEDEAIENLLKFCPWWTKTQAEQSDTDTDGVVSSTAHFSEEEKEQLRQFTNRSYLLDKKCLHHIWLSLVDIILAYTYEIRTTEGEHNVESSWNIRKLSGTLCWLETYNSIQEVLVSFGRRVLCYPLYRNFSLVTAAVRDTALIFQSGKICVLKCLLDIHRIFRENDPAYILNDLYITDYCVWIQRVKSKKVTAVAEPLRKATLHKLDLGLELDELEAAAILAQEEEEEEEEEEAGGGDLKLARSTSHSLSRARSSSSSSEEEEESEDSGSEGTDTDNPPEPASTHRLIEELGESVEAELSISEPLSNTDGGKTKPTGPQGTEAQPQQGPS